jgi:hypothetical protein
MQSQLERRCIGLDVHREFAQVAIWQGGVVRQAGRCGRSRRAWARPMRWRWR